MDEHKAQRASNGLACPDSVRVASPDDEELLMTLLRMMHAENGMSPLDEDKVRGCLRRGLTRDHAIIGVIRGENVIEASIGLFVGSWWYTNDDNRHLEDFWTYVHPEFRKSSHAKDLLRFAKWAAKKLDYPLLVGILSNKRTAPKVQLYERQLGPPVGALFMSKASS
jgi:GNAT superfamily N-acetyltransferase